MRLNRTLIERQGLNDYEVSHIEELHKILQLTMDAMGHCNVEDHLEELRHATKVVESLEYMLQAAWKFPLDPKFHSWWYRVPYCNCPKMDNDDYIGHKNRIFTTSCKLHVIDQPKED